MIIIGYHYVREYSSFYSNSCGIRFLHIQDFKKQLDFFKSNYYLPSVDEFIAYSQGKIELDSKSLLLTFDDGLVDHYKYVFPELVNRNMWGIFFVPANPYLHNKHIGTFALHHLLGRESPDNLINLIKELVSHNISNSEMDFDLYESSLASISDNSSKILFLKHFINSRKFFINESVKEKFILILIDKVLPSLKLDDIYLNKQQIQQMSKENMCIGSHGVTHNYMSDLSFEEQNNEIFSSLNFIDSVVEKSNYKFFGYPYGKLYTINKDTIILLENHKVDAAFLYNEPNLSLNYNFKNSNNKYMIPRVSPDNFKFGDNYRY